MPGESEPLTSAPHGTDETGAPIESVTVTATRLPDWWKIGAVALAVAAVMYFGGDGDDE